MKNFKNISEQEKKDWIEVKVKIPKDTVALIINYLEQKNNSLIAMGNIQFDIDDINKNKLGGDEE